MVSSTDPERDVGGWGVVWEDQLLNPEVYFPVYLDWGFLFRLAEW